MVLHYLAAGADPAVHTPGLYADLSHVIAFVTIVMALLALSRLRPAVRQHRENRKKENDDRSGTAPRWFPVLDD